MNALGIDIALEFMILHGTGWVSWSTYYDFYTRTKWASVSTYIEVEPRLNGALYRLKPEVVAKLKEIEDDKGRGAV